jgi:hypothetical protein
MPTLCILWQKLRLPRPFSSRMTCARRASLTCGCPRQNLVGLVPLALVLGELTEDLAIRFGEVVGGLLVRAAAAPACPWPPTPSASGCVLLGACASVRCLQSGP